MYSYNAVVVSVHDGDGITLLVDLGFDTFHQGPFRLGGCNARELHEPGGIEARDNLAALLPMGTMVSIRTVKPDKYERRYDADIVLPDGRGLVPLLIAEGWAAFWDGTGAKPVPPWPRVV